MKLDRVEARGLVKTFGATRALAGVDVTLEAGRVTVVEGPNGSGKSTLLSLLSLLARPTRGEVRFGDVVASSSAELRGHIGVLAHAAMLYPDLTARESLELYGRLYSVKDLARRIASLRERFEIGGFGDRPARTYSRGQLQRVALARALIHDPQVLFLDEPSTGLDVRAVERLVDAIDAERARGAIVGLITHDDALAARVADRRVALSRGKVAAVRESLRDGAAA